MGFPWKKNLKPGQVFDVGSQTATGIQQAAKQSMLRMAQSAVSNVSMMPLGVFQETQRKDLPEENIVSVVIGWRQWGVGSIWEPTLHSFNGTLWEPYKRLEAKHPLGPSIFDPAGIGNVSCAGIYCSCGIYAYRGRTTLELANLIGHFIMGEVNLWGVVIEHRDGFRAQFAYPRSFVDTGFVARRMATLFGVKLIPKEETSEKSNHAIY